MFAGIIKYLGNVTSFLRKNNGALLEITLSNKDFFSNIESGSSVNVNGVCLTVVKIMNNKLQFFVSEQTLKNTNLSYLKINSVVNLELPLKLSSPLDGHIVLGHIDTIGNVKKIIRKNETMEIFVNNINSKMKYIVEKGSVALEGISLTVQKKEKDGFLVTIIPETYKNTNLKYLKINDKVNIEFDIIGKYVENFVYKPLAFSL